MRLNLLIQKAYLYEMHMVDDHYLETYYGDFAEQASKFGWWLKRDIDLFALALISFNMLEECLEDPDCEDILCYCEAKRNLMRYIG